ncbi:MAG: c-type cytochrome domain-containing protein, partial [Planctomyces sp.]
MNGNTGLRLLCGMLLLGCGEVLFAQQLSFNRDIRPLLSDNCFQCHGPDAAKRQGGLRLDVSEAAIRGGDSGPAVVPGKPEDSLLIQRIHSTDPELQMPPPESGRALTSAQKQVLQQWISSGAEYQPHWAFVPVQRPAVPAEEPPCGPLDAFLRQRQKMAGLQPAP